MLPIWVTDGREGSTLVGSDYRASEPICSDAISPLNTGCWIILTCCGKRKV